MEKAGRKEIKRVMGMMMGHRMVAMGMAMVIGPITLALALFHFLPHSPAINRNR
jgi:hypothetical protein